MLHGYHSHVSLKVIGFLIMGDMGYSFVLS